MRIDILTLFPQAVEPYLETSIIGRAKEAQVIDIRTWNIRDYTTGKHRTVDDSPYGGGAGMVMKVEPIDLALKAAVHGQDNTKKKIVVLAARGTPFTQQKALEYATLDQLILICGRYEGIDQRVADHLADEEISIGPYVLAGGELPALVVMEAVARHIPGVLGNPESLSEESFTQDAIEYPQYTKPEEYNGWKVPPVLLSGDHATIKAWRDKSRHDNLKS
ncbi:MAG: tRNA (guanosine(37)-N1)-methyltransferase TrmD [Candidatus Andersenbacteria bacterium]|nr:tRNA (guanosine(37)-N1)-methyltransferase TrmD [Candidatus Andersenbacteria bacterium]MBI3250723.1 tRNA (guanosine(37)-N1)-methyltransferase TrmD [Candidatus Andersenbacteria bacterium]